MDPWIAALLGAAGASVVWAVVLAARARGQQPAAARRRRRGQEPTSAAADLVPLVFAPMTALKEIIDAAKPELRSLFAPGGNVALVFSDVVDSTLVNQQLGDRAWAQLLRQHDEAVRAVVKEAGGRVVKTQGDGFMAAFHDATSAARAAARMQHAVRDATSDAGTRLQLRIGVHVGEVVSQRGDYFGTNVVLAARVAATARPGTVLVTDEVAVAIDGAAGLVTVPLRRPTRLRGLPGRHQLHRLHT